jgi:hypothetical protein
MAAAVAAYQQKEVVEVAESYTYSSMQPLVHRDCH